MSSGAIDGQLRHADQTAKEHRQHDGHVVEESQMTAVKRIPDLGWATAHSQYDWMDLHGPFASLD